MSDYSVDCTKTLDPLKLALPHVTNTCMIVYPLLQNADYLIVSKSTFILGVYLLFTSMGVDYVVIGFDMEVKPLVTNNAALPLRVSALCIDHLHMPRALLA